MNRPSKEWSGRPTQPLPAPLSLEHLRTTLHSTHHQHQQSLNHHHHQLAKSHVTVERWRRSRGKTQQTVHPLLRVEPRHRLTLLVALVNSVLLSSSVERFSKSCLARDMRSVLTYLLLSCLSIVYSAESCWLLVTKGCRQICLGSPVRPGSHDLGPPGKPWKWW